MIFILQPAVNDSKFHRVKPQISTFWCKVFSEEETILLIFCLFITIKKAHMDGGNVFEASKFGGLCGQLMLVAFFFSNLYIESNYAKTEFP